MPRMGRRDQEVQLQLGALVLQQGVRDEAAPDAGCRDLQLVGMVRVSSMELCVQTLLLEWKPTPTWLVLHVISVQPERHHFRFGGEGQL